MYIVESKYALHFLYKLGLKCFGSKCVTLEKKLNPILEHPVFGNDHTTTYHFFPSSVSLPVFCPNRCCFLSVFYSK